MKVLAIDDSAVYRHLLLTQLAEFEAEAVDSAESALSMLSQWAEPAVFVLDWQLPGMSGLELTEQLRSQPGKHYVYVLVLTAHSDPADVVTALDAGADDYLGKPFEEAELKARIRVAIRSLKLHEELLTANESLEALASQDQLTMLYNRRGLLRLYHRELLLARRNQSPVSVVACDIDNLKKINDAHGHPVGDEALRVVALALQSSSRGSDIVARTGGDEFVVVLPGTDSRGGVIFVERVQEYLAQEKNLRELPVPITMSFGIAGMDISGGEEDAIAKADAALCEAKREGKNCHRVAE
jgi:two-component system cell cycle response regulator